MRGLQPRPSQPEAAEAPRGWTLCLRQLSVTIQGALRLFHVADENQGPDKGGHLLRTVQPPGSVVRPRSQAS